MKSATRHLIFGVFLFLVPNCSAALLYVDFNSPALTPRSTNWATAARIIQDAVEAAGPLGY
jgi:hypothetical protein